MMLSACCALVLSAAAGRLCVQLASVCEVRVCGCRQAVRAACFVQVLLNSGEEENSSSAVNFCMQCW